MVHHQQLEAESGWSHRHPR